VDATAWPAPLSRSQIGRAAATLALAFDEDPLYVRLLPDPQRRRRLLTLLWQGVLRYSLRYGIAYASPELTGVAAWLAPGAMDITPWRQLRSGLVLPRAVFRFPREARHRTLAYIGHLDHLGRELMGDHPCWYLWALGVEPSARGRGMGGALLSPVLERADRDRLPCYLETFNERDLPFYERHGYRIVWSGSMPGEDVPVWTMLREPGGSGP
jgi:GNAT superfamily N-acetyltransferase